MSNEESYLVKGKCVIAISVALIILSIGLFLTRNIIANNQYYNLAFEQINIKNMSTVSVAFKKSSATTLVSQVKLTEKPFVTKQVVNENPSQPVQAKPLVQEKPKQQWYLPTYNGTITSYPYYGHVALDITSPNGVYEAIYPVAEGTISAIYRDYAGALIVMINHNINGKNYVSQYVHLSSYAPGIYVGKHVGVHDRIGQMGRTGISTGVHLHLAVLECSLYNDYNCQTLGHFFDFANYQYRTGFYGLQSVMNVPYSWNSR